MPGGRNTNSPTSATLARYRQPYDRLELYSTATKGIVPKLNINWTPVERDSLIAFNDSLFSSTQPINGLRHPKKEKMDGWFYGVGVHFRKMMKNILKPLHIEHLLEKRPLVLKYLGLPAGWRFQIDDLGYEDIWFDNSISI